MFNFIKKLMAKKPTTPKKAEPKKEEAKKSQTNKIADAIDKIAKKGKTKVVNANTKDATLNTENIGSTTIIPVVNDDFGKEEIVIASIPTPEFVETITIENPLVIEPIVEIPTPTAEMPIPPKPPIRNMNELMAENQLIAFANSLEDGLKSNNSLKRHGIMPLKEITIMIESSPKEYSYSISREGEGCAIIVSKGALSQRVPKNDSEWFIVY